jgi:hypothetical protein
LIAQLAGDPKMQLKRASPIGNGAPVSFSKEDLMCKHDNHTQPSQTGSPSCKGRRRKQSPEEEALSHFTEDWQKAFDLDFVPELWFGQETSRVEWDASKRRPLTLDLLCQILSNGLDEATEGELGPHALEFLSRLGYATCSWKADWSLGFEWDIVSILYSGLVDGSMSGTLTKEEWSDLSLWVPRGTAVQDWIHVLQEMGQDPLKPETEALKANRTQLEAVLSTIDPEGKKPHAVLACRGLLPQDQVYGVAEEDQYCRDCGNWHTECCCWCDTCGLNMNHDCQCLKCPDCDRSYANCWCDPCSTCEKWPFECTCYCHFCDSEIEQCSCERCPVCGIVTSHCECNQADGDTEAKGEDVAAESDPLTTLLRETDCEPTGGAFSATSLKPLTLAQLIILLEESGLFFDAILEYNNGAGMDITKENWQAAMQVHCPTYPQLLPYLYEAIKHCDWIPES